MSGRRTVSDLDPALSCLQHVAVSRNQASSLSDTRGSSLLAFHIDLATIPMDRLRRIAGKGKQRHPNLALRPVRRKTLKHDLIKVKEVYNAAWQNNWGFVPMTDAEVDFMAGRLKPLLMEGRGAG